MKILFILQYVPFPLNSGGNQAMFNMIEPIRKKHQVSLLFYIKSQAELEGIDQLQKRWTDVDFHFQKAPWLSGLSSKEPEKPQEALPTSLSYRFFDSIRRSMERKTNRRIRKFRMKQAKQVCKASSSTPPIQEDFVRSHSCIFNSIPCLDAPEEFLDFVYQVARKGFDVIQTEFYECLPLVYLLPENAIKVFVQHEIRYIRNQNELKLFKEIRPKDLLRFQTLKDAEEKALSHYDKIIALTETDRDIMWQANPELDIYVSPAAVSLPASTMQYKQAATDLVFVGSGDHFPNADGVMWFCSEVLPLLKRKGLDIRLHVIGVWNELLRLQLQARVSDLVFTGFIEDLPSFINGKISIVPIRIGSGMRMKILDSVFAASPIVTTSKGCEGLPLAHEKDCYIADTAEDFAHAVAQLLEHPETQKKFTEECRLKFNGSFSTANMQKRRLEFYENLQPKKTS